MRKTPPELQLWVPSHRRSNRVKLYIYYSRFPLDHNYYTACPLDTYYRATLVNMIFGYYIKIVK